MFSVPHSHKLHSSYGNPVVREWYSKLPRASDLIYPIFISDDKDELEEMKTLPGQYRLGVNKVKEYLSPMVAKGLKSVLVFGVLTNKEDTNSKATKAIDGPTQEGIEAIKSHFPDLLVAADVCLCAFTSHGHCCIMNDLEQIDYDQTLYTLGMISVSNAKAGADMIAPSDMMDGRVHAIKVCLEKAGYHLPILSYSAKFSSSFYGPFRDVCKSAPSKKDRKGYQLPPDSKELAMKAVKRDLEEGADFVMIKPSVPYLDIASAIKSKFDCTLACYHVSGEYAMIEFAARNGALDKKQV